MSSDEARKPTPSRRELVRDRTRADILQAARRALVRDGAEGVTLRAIARELGMTAPGLYRYYPSHQALLSQLVAEIYDEVAADLRAARDGVDDPVEQLLVVARRFREWALMHPREFGLVFAYPVRTTWDASADNPADAAGLRFAGVFAESLVASYERAPFAVSADADIEPMLRRQLEEWRARFPVKMPIGALQVFLMGWIRIYGMVCMEVFGHLRFALSDGEAMYEQEIQGLAEMLRRGS